MNSPNVGQALENANAAVSHHLGGDHAWDLPRVLGLPYTLNLKDPANPKQRSILEIHPERLYKLNDFDDLLPPPSNNGAEASQPIEVKFTDQVPPVGLESLRVSQKMKDLIQNGFRQGDNYKSRSEAMQAVVTAMLAKTHTLDEIKAVFANFRIGERYREEGKSADKYLASCIRNAARYVESKKLESCEGIGPYPIINGCFCTQTREGPKQLCNFTARIIEEILFDDGDKETRHYRIEGKTGSGLSLPSVIISASDFRKMTWVSEKWGINAILSAGSAAQDKIREAIERSSLEVRKSRNFIHTGWRKLDSQWVYLYNGGAIGAPDLPVHLEGDLHRFRVGLSENAEEKDRALRVAYDVLDIGLPSIMVPIWASAFLAPLCTFIPIGHILYLSGTSGCFKSTVATILQSFFGDYETKETLPGSFLSTRNALERLCFLLKDAPVVIDDWAPAATSKEASEMQGKMHSLVRGVTNHASRMRLKPDSSFQKTFDVRSLVVMTAEQLPGVGESGMARLFVVNFQRGGIDKGKLSRIQALTGLLPLAMGAYIDYIRPNLEEVVKNVKSDWKNLRDKFKLDGHLRIPESAAYLQIGLRLGLGFLKDSGILTAQQHDERLKECDDVLQELARQQASGVTENKPTLRYLRALEEIIVTRKAYIRGGATYGDELGWSNDEYLFLFPQAALAKVMEVMRDTGKHFGISDKALDRMLHEEGFLIRNEASESDKNRYTIRIRDPLTNELVSVIRLSRPKVEEVVSLIRGPR